MTSKFAILKFRFLIICRSLQSIVALSLCVASVTFAEGPERYKVGGIYGLSGLMADFGGQFANGAKLYLATHKDSKIELLIEDSKWDSKEAVAAFNKLTTIDNVQAVHVMGSGPSLSVKPLAEGKRILQLSAGAHPEILPNTELTIQHANLASVDAAVFATAVGKTIYPESTIASIYIQNDWGKSYSDTFVSVLHEKYPHLTVLAESHLPTETDFRSILTNLIKKRPALLAINSTGVPDALIVEQARQLGFVAPIYLNNGLDLSADAKKRLRDRKDGKLFYQRYPAVPEKFSKLYQAQFGILPDFFGAVSYSDMELINAAVVSVGPDNAAITKYIKGLGTFKGEYLSLDITPEGFISIPTTVERFN